MFYQTAQPGLCSSAFFHAGGLDVYMGITRELLPLLCLYGPCMSLLVSVAEGVGMVEGRVI